ncbi:transcriptional repressor general negative regulator of transcription subunit 4, partial [Rhizophlyctis rosea]
MARIKNAKKKKERERREQDIAAKRHMQNARVVQKTLVYVLNLPLKVITDEILRTPEWFGQFGKIVRITLGRRGNVYTPVLANLPNTGVYVQFAKEQVAERAIYAIDGTVCDGKVLKATYGATKYCAYYLKNQPCPNSSNGTCFNLHEQGEDADIFAKDELNRMHMRERSMRPSPFPSTSTKKEESEERALPATASWAKPIARPQSSISRSTSSDANFPPVSASAATNAPRSAYGSEVESEDHYEHDLASASNRKAELDYTISAASDRDKPAPEKVERTYKVERRKLKPKNAVENVPPPGLAGASSASSAKSPVPQPASEPQEEEKTLGSSALEDDSSRSESAAVSPPPSLSAPSEASSRPAVEPSFDDSLSPSALGYILHPKYIGPFDPFREDLLTAYLTGLSEGTG